MLLSRLRKVELGELSGQPKDGGVIGFGGAVTATFTPA
jgi:hypothetical protein